MASNRIIIPVYYDKALKSKYARDYQSAEMLDIIRQGLTLDFGSFFAVQLKDAGFPDAYYHTRQEGVCLHL